jgi:hypothetical protein
MARSDQASRCDEEPRRHLRGPVHEHPAIRAPEAPSELSVMDWLLGVGHAVTRKLRGVPMSPIVPLHPKR